MKTMKTQKADGSVSDSIRSRALKFLCVAVVAAFALSNAEADECPVYWSMWGAINTSTMTPVMVGVSSGTLPAILLKSPTTPDCYQLAVQPNGTLYTIWVQCP
jgi:hypothetical protein